MVLLSIVPGFLTSACMNAALGRRTWCGRAAPLAPRLGLSRAVALKER